MALKDFFRALFTSPAVQAARAYDELAAENKRKAEELQQRVAANFKSFKDALDTPVIFANGIDNDLPGLEAALQNRAVWYEGKRYEPGQTLCIEGRILSLPCHRWVWRVESDDMVMLFDPRGMMQFEARYVDASVTAWAADGGKLHVTDLPARNGREVDFGVVTFRFAVEDL